MELPEEECWAMVCDGAGQALRRENRNLRQPEGHELLVRVRACGVCRTDLHVCDGDIPASYPIVPGHEIVGEVIATGDNAEGFEIGNRVGIAWLGQSCGICQFCLRGEENLCDQPVFTGATRDGGYATHAIADARFCFPIPNGLSDLDAAPLLCAGLIGWRSFRMAGPVTTIGLYGFGAAAHLIAQLAIAQGVEVYAFTREDDRESQEFARALGCVWAGSSDTSSPELLDAAIIFAPVGSLVPTALKSVRKGGRVICAGIHMSDIPAFAYSDLWGERSVHSVANLTRDDGRTFFASEHLSKVRSHVTRYALADANQALADLRDGKLQGAAALVPS